MSKDEALKLALEALIAEYHMETSSFARRVDDIFKEALVAPVQEPVAWGIIASNTGRICQVELDAAEVEGHNPKHIVPLYTAPPAAQRQWVGLSQDELDAMFSNTIKGKKLVNWVARAIEAKLKEKNT
jgi:uncharacterized linocin/CFP29 family protein